MGTSFGAFMRSSIFEPLGIQHTRVHNTCRSAGERLENFAVGYAHSEGLGRYPEPDSLKEFEQVIHQDAIVGDVTVVSSTRALAV